MNKRPFYSITEMTLPELEIVCTSHGEPAYRAKQIMSWIYKKGISTFEHMSNLSRNFRKQLAKEYKIFQTKIDTINRSRDGTEKYLIRLLDNNTIESVLLRDSKRVTVCVSTQVGCAMGCRFCASGVFGLERNLNPGEIVEQVLRLKNALPPNEHITNVVFMGIGEPLANYDNVIKALKIINADWGLGIGLRHITISTVGITEKIKQLAKEGIKVNLAISLHSPNNTIRNKIIPSNKKTGIKKLITAAQEYFKATHRDISFEYILIDNMNASKQDALSLAQLLKGIQCNINILSLNPVKEFNLHPPSTNRIHTFRNTLEKSGFVVTIRQKKGDKINAACGQLRLQKRNIHDTQARKGL